MFQRRDGIDEQAGGDGEEHADGRGGCIAKQSAHRFKTGRIVQVHVAVVQPLQEQGELALVLAVTRQVFSHRGLHEIAEFRIAHAAAGGAHQAEIRRQQPFGMQAVQRGDQHALGKVAGGAQQDQGGGRQLGRIRHGPIQAGKKAKSNRPAPICAIRSRIGKRELSMPHPPPLRLPRQPDRGQLHRLRPLRPLRLLPARLVVRGHVRRAGGERLLHVVPVHRLQHHRL